MHLPADPSSAVLFICTGTGYAPMRGLLLQRAYLLRRGQKLGPAYIIFGSRSSKEGLFTDEIKMFHQLGALTEVHHCYSREPGKKKMYATTKLRSAVFLEPFLACEYINQYFKSAHSYIMHFIFFLICPSSSILSSSSSEKLSHLHLWIGELGRGMQGHHEGAYLQRKL